MSKQINEAVNAALAQFGIVLNVEHKGAMLKHDFGTDDKPWDCDHWEVTFHNVGHAAPLLRTAYYTGSGHRKVPDGKVIWMNRELKECHSSQHAAIRARYAKAVAPVAADILHSLLLDASAIEQSFNDWCADMGGNSDSIKAFQTYQACCAIGEALRRIFTHAQMQQLSELLQDY